MFATAVALFPEKAESEALFARFRNHSPNGRSKVRAKSPVIRKRFPSKSKPPHKAAESQNSGELGHPEAFHIEKSAFILDPSLIPAQLACLR